MKRLKIACFLVAFSLTGISDSVFAWSWNSPDNVLPSLREELDKEIASYRQRVGNGLSLHERIIVLDRLIDTYKPSGLNVADLEVERDRMMLQEKQQELRTSQAQDQATLLYDQGVKAYREGEFQTSMETFKSAERLLPDDNAIKELRHKLESIVPIVESEPGNDKGSRLLRLAIIHFLENDPKRALNVIIYAGDQKIERREFDRLQRLIENNHPEIEAPRIAPGVTLVDHKLQITLESIYDGRYLSAISECSDVLDLEPENVLALTRLGSAYYAMNEQEKARQIWTKALQLNPDNEVLKKFLYGSKGSYRVEAH